MSYTTCLLKIHIHGLWCLCSMGSKRWTIGLTLSASRLVCQCHWQMGFVLLFFNSFSFLYPTFHKFVVLKNFGILPPLIILLWQILQIALEWPSQTSKCGLFNFGLAITITSSLTSTVTKASLQVAGSSTRHMNTMCAYQWIKYQY